MKASIQTGISLNHDTIGDLRSVGYRHFDLALSFGTSPDEGLVKERFERIDTVTEWALDAKSRHGIDFVMAHCPYTFNPCDSEDDFNIQVQDSLDAIRVCNALGIDRMTVHAGFGRHNKDYEEMLEANVRYYSAILPEAEKNGVTLMVENISESIYKQPFVIETADNILRLYEMLGKPKYFGACWDTGHANTLALDQYDNITRLGDLLKGVHLHDNYGFQDDHQMPLLGTVNFDEVIKGLKDVNYAGPFNFEASIFKSGNGWPNYRHKATEKSNAEPNLFDPDEELKMLGYSTMYKIALYMLKKHNIFIE